MGIIIKTLKLNALYTKLRSALKLYKKRLCIISMNQKRGFKICV